MRFALPLVLVLAGCGARRPSTKALYEESRGLLRSEHYQAARAETERALAHAEPGSGWYWRLRLLRVEILLEQRELKLARQALDFRLPSGAQWGRERTRYLICQADIAYRQGELAAALSRLDEAQTLARATDAADLLPEIEFRRAKVALAQRDFTAAEAGLHRVVEEAARRNDPYLQMKAKGNLGYLLLRAFRYEEAIPWFEEALRASQALGTADDEARSMLNLGWCYYRLGDLDKAQHYFAEAEARFEKTGNRADSQSCLGNMASTLYSRHDYPAATALYQRALEMATQLGDRQQRAIWLTNLAKTAIETANWDAAERYNNEAWALAKGPRERGLEAFAEANAGYIAAGRKDWARSEQLFSTVIRAEREDPVAVLDARSGLAHTLADEGKDAKAEAEYRAGGTMLERQRAALLKDQDKLSYFSSLIEFYQEYVDYLMTRGRVRKALEVAESSRARVLADQLSLRHIQTGPRTAAGFERLAAAYGGVLFSYWLGPRASYLWVVTRSRVSAFHLPPEPRIRAMVETYDAIIQDLRDPLTVENPAGRQLYETLIAPAKALVGRNARIIVAPDGPLYALNFETLPVEEPAPHYWIEDATLAVTPSLGLLSAGAAPRGQAEKSLLLIGNPVSPVAQYPKLEFAPQEMAGIEKDMSAWHPVVLGGERAVPEAYAKADPGRFRYIHFVAHAVANPEEPLESAVILSRQGTHYKLRARDVLGIRLHAALVTISACRSAGARVYGGEGLVGLAWAFLEAGAGKVIAGLWDVNDRSTADLVTNLYAGLARGASASDALRAAKLELIHSRGAYGKPYYWAPFEVFARRVR